MNEKPRKPKEMIDRLKKGGYHKDQSKYDRNDEKTALDKEIEEAYNELYDNQINTGC